MKRCPCEVQKAVCYVVHDGHLLVFTHDDTPITDTGVQGPAGSIKPGESPEQAAIRELLEETGSTSSADPWRRYPRYRLESINYRMGRLRS
ncbi:NUDIX domain-containing protein [Arthrobacter antioxidans]|uniref:NUDIX domain-containing protein n=1 Tax=Arthrobacter antioxidans TaxID=2895818 RepID=UPI001FFE8D54|nr:NUDIX domain-containing protein [Arthrobacter antioxidans]